jgi:RPA family protein
MPDNTTSQPTEIRRQIAYKCSISALNNSVFVKKQGWESSYVMTDYGDFSRINIIGVIVAKDENSITLDDNTGQITGRFFNEPTKLLDFNIGDLVLVIARPREFNNQRYLALEIIKKIKNKGWIPYRKKELSLIKKLRNIDDIKSQETKKAEPEIVENISTVNSKDRIIDVIKQLDSGSGASIDDIIHISKIKNAEDIVKDMVLRGEIFELKPGKIKILN